MLTEGDRKYSERDPAVSACVAAIIPPGARVLEVGPGQNPFERATHFTDWGTYENGVAVHCDFNRDPLPYADKAFDFVFCRHILEDLFNPFNLCREMARVGRAGYIETPAPLAEITRGIDGGSPPWRGYIHHRYFVYNDGGRLTFLTKYPVVEHLSFTGEARVEGLLRSGPLYWNTYFLWSDTFEPAFVQHEVDYGLFTGYHGKILNAVNAGIDAATEFGRWMAAAGSR